MAYFNINHHQHSEDLLIVGKRDINQSYYVLTLKSSYQFPLIEPGQFVNVLVDNSPTTFLRRPISIYDVDFEQSTIDLLILKAGDGTRKLAEKNIGDMVNLLFPLGRGFTCDASVGKVLMIGGGVGLAPLLFLGKQLVNEGVEVHTLIGGRSKDYIIEMEKFELLGKVYISTDDGSFGEKGLLTANSIISELSAFDKVFTCGPDPMMKAVALLCDAYGVSCEVSLENLMACGIGSCLCCVEDTVDGHKCACTDGPVFNTKLLKWI